MWHPPSSQVQSMAAKKKTCGSSSVSTKTKAGKGKQTKAGKRKPSTTPSVKKRASQAAALAAAEKRRVESEKRHGRRLRQRAAAADKAQAAARPAKVSAPRVPSQPMSHPPPPLSPSDLEVDATNLQLISDEDLTIEPNRPMGVVWRCLRQTNEAKLLFRRVSEPWDFGHPY